MTKGRYLKTVPGMFPVLEKAMHHYVEERKFDKAQRIGKKLFEEYCDFDMVEKAEKVAGEAYPTIFVPEYSQWTEYSGLAENPAYKKALERKGLKMLDELPDEIRFSHYYGAWAFGTEGVGEAEGVLYKAGTKAAWEGLGELYKRAAATAERIDGGSAFISRGGSCNSRDLNAYWSIRAYLKTGDEQKAIEALERFKDYRSVVITLKNQSQKPEKENPERGFDIPDLSGFPEFRKAMESM